MANQTNAGKAVLLTGQGAAALAVVRLIGEGVPLFLRNHFSRQAKAGRCVHGELSGADGVIDDPVVVIGGDGQWCDISLHGGPWVVRAVLELAKAAGFVVETAAVDVADGETLLEREVQAHLPSARTKLAIAALLAQTDCWSGKDITGLEAEEILADRALWWLLNPPRVAIVGAANVGKSTLANQVFAQERSITADLPGTTRDWVGELANVDGLAVMLVDTPGMRATEDVVERMAIEQSVEQIRCADLVVVVLDASRPLAGDQESAVSQHPGPIVVLNKFDRAVEDWQRAGNSVRTVATSGDGVDLLRRQIKERFGCQDLDVKKRRWWTQRQRLILEAGIKAPELLASLWH